MKVLSAALSELVGLFVADWIQTAVIIGILAAGWLGVVRVGAVALAPLVLLLAAQLVWFARAESRRSRAG
ncbi:MAG TPA: hypothetical protein VET26_09025 [Candidatus Sulfotelmatobacter sp.]|nr:hypothetical protein [Candidatus Sulfotelmatobacter sp.]